MTRLHATLGSGGGGVNAVRLDGRLASGRDASVSFFAKSAGKTTIPMIRFTVDADPALSVSVYEESLLTPLAKWLGVTKDVDTGDAAFDDRFVVATSGEKRARGAYARGFKEAVRSAFERHRVHTFEIRGGKLEVTLQRHAIETSQYANLLATLDEAAHAFDRVEITVRALGGVSRRALSAHGGPRCAYCHDGITGDEADLVACDRCHTVLHAGCWQELGHCPLLGCGGSSPERARPIDSGPASQVPRSG